MNTMYKFNSDGMNEQKTNFYFYAIKNQKADEGIFIKINKSMKKRTPYHFNQ